MLKLVIFYESRNEFIKKNSKKNNIQIIKKLSTFLLDKSDIEELYNDIIKEFDSKNVILLESNDIFNFNQTIKNKSNILFWNITDGIGLYKGSHIPSYAKLLDLNFFGSPTYAQVIAQDKYKFMQKCKSLSIDTPSSYLYNKQSYIKGIDNLPIYNQYFVKLNDFDNNIGILENAKCDTFQKCKEVAEELYLEYKYNILIQEYIDGDDIRVSYLDIENSTEPLYNRINDIENSLGIYFINKSQKEHTLDYIHENLEEYDFNIVKVVDKHIISSITKSIKKIILDLKIKDYFAADFRVCKKTSKVYILEINTAPFISSTRFKYYINDFYNLSLAKAFSKSIIKYFD